MTGQPLPPFEFATAQRIRFGAGRARELAALAAPFGKHALVVTGKSMRRAEPLTDGLVEAHIELAFVSVPQEPTLDDVMRGIETAHSAGAQMVIGIGGGSALDAAKAIAVLAGNPGDPLEYLEVVGQGKPFARPGLPCIAVPTTAGTGSEATRNAVLAIPEKRTKVSLRGAEVLPRVALVDPELTHSLPPAVTAASGMDALTQVLEPFVSLDANPFTDGICREALRRVGDALRSAFHEPQNAAARADMAFVSLSGGMALANARVAAVHGIAGPLGGMSNAPHGAVCGRLLPYVTAANIRALKAREPGHPALARYDEAARLLTGDPDISGSDVVVWLEALCDELEIPRLRDWGLQESEFPELIVKAMRTSSMRGNPIVLNANELKDVLRQAL